MATATFTPHSNALHVSARWRKIFRCLPFDIFRDADGYYFDEEAADYVIEFVETRLHYMEGDLYGELIRLENWQKAIFGAVFGWKSLKDNLRRFRNVWFYIPRKNTKTMMLAIFAIIMLVLEAEGGQQIYNAAANEEQAKITFGMAKGMIAQDEELADMIKIGAETMHCDGNTFKIIASGSKGKHGKNVNFAAIDEVHEHKTPDLINALITSKIARSQPLFIEATTADEEGESYCNDRHEYAKNVRDGVFRVASFLPIIYEATDPKRWKSEKLWREVNPNLGVSIKIEALRELALKAEQMPSFKPEFMRLHLNMKVQSANRWIDMNDWDLCDGREVGESPMQWQRRMLEAFKGKPCWCGLDIGSVSDLTALAMLFDGAEIGLDDTLILLARCWCPEDALTKKGEEFQKVYRQWVEEGFLETTAGNVADYTVITREIVEQHHSHPFKSIGVDTAFQGLAPATALGNDHGIDVKEFRQSFYDFAAPCVEFESRIMSGRILHGGNPMLRWQAGNVLALKDASGRMRPVKDGKNSPRKIDAIVAAIEAVGIWMARDENDVTSGYNNPQNRLFVL